MKTYERRISIKGIDPFPLLGPHDEYLRMIEAAFASKIVLRGDELRCVGDPVALDKLEQVWMEILLTLNKSGRVDREDVERAILTVQEGRSTEEIASASSEFKFFTKKGIIRPKTKGQEAYCAAVSANDIVFVIGPAGTGKTYLAVAMALAKLREKEVSRIILTRPAIEAGESLGFLPGDLMEKVDPYLRPLTDALFDMVPSDQLQKYFERHIVEIVPLAYMRGRTLNDAFVILDEAQNTTPIQMKMFLTRLGFNSRAIVTGDITQVDLPERTVSGLIQIQQILKGIEGIAFVYLDKEDVVRHRLVKDILRAYESFDENQNASGNG